MNAIEATFKNGQIIPDGPTDWPEGCRLRIEPVDAPNHVEDEDKPPTPDVIAARLALMDQLEPGWLSPEDDVAWRTALQQQKAYEKARFNEDAEKLRRMWE